MSNECMNGKRVEVETTGGMIYRGTVARAVTVGGRYWIELSEDAERILPSPRKIGQRVSFSPRELQNFYLLE